MKKFEHYLNAVKMTNETFDVDTLDKHVLAFLVKYGPKYIDNDASILEYLQNNDEDHSDEAAQKALKEALAKTRSANEKLTPFDVNGFVTWMDKNSELGSMDSLDAKYAEYDAYLTKFDRKHIPVVLSDADKTLLMTELDARGMIAENMKSDDLKRLLVKYTDWLFKNGHAVRNGTAGDDKLVDMFMNKSESALNEGYNWMVVTVPPVDEWKDWTDDKLAQCKAFTYMDKQWTIRPGQEKFFADSVGKNVKFKWNPDDKNHYMELPAVTGQAV